MNIGICAMHNPWRELQMLEDSSLFVTFYRLVSDHNLAALCIHMLLSLFLLLYLY